MNCLKCKQEIERLKSELTKYKKLSVYDTLTEVYNLRKLEKDIDRYCHLQDRYKGNYLVVMIDVDGLKQVNDTRGHDEGDIMIKRVANTLKYNIRRGDKVYRRSGDEFVLILSHTKIEDKHILERIRKELSRHNISISIGCSKLCENVLDIADRRMYIEKENKKRRGKK
jgi:diguanylate cyclase (GGDEF)-like protein